MSRKSISEPTAFTSEEIEALRRWHRRVVGAATCEQGDPWPCRTARFLVTLDGQSNPAKIAAFYAEWNARLEAEELAARHIRDGL